MLKYKIPQIVTLTHEILFKEYPDIKKGYYLSMRLGLIYHQRKFRLSGNFWLLSFKISYLCLPLFYETRTTPSCHPSGCAYRQL